MYEEVADILVSEIWTMESLQSPISSIHSNLFNPMLKDSQILHAECRNKDVRE